MKKLLALALWVLILLTLFTGTVGAEDEAHLRKVFLTAVFNIEYGDDSSAVLHRWENPIVIWAGEEMTDRDEKALFDFADQLDARVANLPPIYWTRKSDEANVTIAYVPLDKMQEYSESYVEGNWGFVSFWWNDAQEMVYAQIAIASDVTSQIERNHLLMEELAGALGLTNDIDSDPDSIIHQEWTTTQELSGMDWALLNLLYDERLTPGMSWEEVSAALEW